mmetsp:Transcript_15018/g.35418  ORF Transcript_15018/g.35418 Transcript_15018/m.35418 type:complete len:359 (-) Transcript_15018:366-1442(-)
MQNQPFGQMGQQGQQGQQQHSPSHSPSRQPQQPQQDWNVPKIELPKPFVPSYDPTQFRCDSPHSSCSSASSPSPPSSPDSPRSPSNADREEKMIKGLNKSAHRIDDVHKALQQAKAQIHANSWNRVGKLEKEANKMRTALVEAQNKTREFESERNKVLAENQRQEHEIKQLRSRLQDAERHAHNSLQDAQRLHEADLALVKNNLRAKEREVSQLESRNKALERDVHEARERGARDVQAVEQKLAALEREFSNRDGSRQDSSRSPALLPARTYQAPSSYPPPSTLQQPSYAPPPQRSQAMDRRPPPPSSSYPSNTSYHASPSNTSYSDRDGRPSGPIGVAGYVPYAPPNQGRPGYREAV